MSCTNSGLWVLLRKFSGIFWSWLQPIWGRDDDDASTQSHFDFGEMIVRENPHHLIDCGEFLGKEMTSPLAATLDILCQQGQLASNQYAPMQRLHNVKYVYG
jgi:hypothetical protein